MATATTTTVVSNAASVNFQTWVTEMIVQLLGVGLTQTADTGQMANPCVTALPGGASTAAGYYVFAFNDALQATAPLYIKLECGTGSAVTIPNMWITIGSGTNGAGTITGIVGTRWPLCASNQSVVSTVTNYISRWCYNATQGFLGLSWKQGSVSGGNAQMSFGGFVIYRSVNSSGATTGDSVHFITNGTGSSGSSGFLQMNSYNTGFSSSGAAPITNNQTWTQVPFTTTTTLQGTSTQCFPIWQWVGSATLSGYGITNACAMAILSEAAMGTTIPITILGSSPLTYISVGAPFGNNTITNLNYATTAYTILMLWQ